MERREIREDGVSLIEVDTSSPLFANLEKNQSVLLTHGDTVVEPAKEFRIIAIAKGGINAGLESTAKNIYGVQFHPEVEWIIFLR